MECQVKQLFDLVKNTVEWRSYVNEGKFHIQTITTSSVVQDPQWYKIYNIFPGNEIDLSHDYILISMDEPVLFLISFIQHAESRGIYVKQPYYNPGMFIGYKNQS